MPDLSEQLSAILQNPEAQKNIQNLLSSLGQNQPQNPENSAPPFDFSSLFGQNQQKAPEPQIPDFDIKTLMKLQEIFSKMSCDDRNINLLTALRPLLKNPEKVDGAINILRIMSVLPALEESGIFGGGRF
ncbi:MAG: hypothetical protein J6J07_09985 [Oscillospiraceae bacterium]|nr:hypothetical protein [Oscillospiraceae bacterium]MBQ5323747.1 hypothetical protein [Oscillospiraceae bacterium]